MFRGRRCHKCGTSHKPRQCPAFHDVCDACGKKGHWKACCRSKRKGCRYSRPRNRSKNTHDRSNSGNHRKQKYPKDFQEKKIQSVDTEYETDGEMYQKTFYSITISNKCLESISHRSKTCDEAYTTLNIQPPGLPEDDFTLRLKIDTGAAGNTLPLRTLKLNRCTEKMQM